MLKEKAISIKEKSEKIIGKAMEAAGFRNFGGMSDEQTLLVRDSMQLFDESLDYMLDYSEKLDRIEKEISLLNTKLSILMDMKEVEKKKE